MIFLNTILYFTHYFSYSLESFLIFHASFCVENTSSLARLVWLEVLLVGWRSNLVWTACQRSQTVPSEGEEVTAHSTLFTTEVDQRTDTGP